MSEKWPNYYSIAGDKAGNLWITILGSPARLVRQAPASGDIPWYEIDEVVIDLVAAGVDSATIADVFKLSGVRRLRIFRDLIVHTGGRQHENAFDANNECDEIEIGEGGRIELEEGQQNAFTWKGGSGRGKLWNGVIIGRGGHCDLEVGGRSEQSSKKSKVSLVRWRHADGGRLRLRVEQAEMPALIDTPCGFQALTSFAILLWIWIRDPRCFREYFFGEAA